MPAGRPSNFKKLDLSKVAALAKKGWTDLEMSAFFEIHVATWYRWKNAHPEFCDALKEWKDEADSVVERSLYERATGYACPEDKIFNDSGKPMIVPTTKHYPPDTTAAIFWLKNRDTENWRDKTEREHSGSVALKDMDDEALDARIKSLLNK